MSLYADVDTENYYDSIEISLLKKKGSSKFPSNEDLKTALKDRDLYNIQAKNRKYMFEMIENFNNREYVDTSNENITIEHIFPRNPHVNWSTELKPEDYFEFKEKRLNTIGNLTLSGNNGALSNKAFSEKQSMNIDGKEQGYEFSRLWLNTYLKNIDNWTIENYNERFEIISERFLQIWEYPKVIVPETNSNTEQNIFVAESPTNKKLDYFIFEDNKVEEFHIAGMYDHVIKSLFNKNTQLLINNQDILKITKNEEDFRMCGEVMNGYFIEYNIDSRSKFFILKRLLTLFELEDELTIKYKSEEIESSRFSIRKKYWQQLLPLIENTTLFSNISPSKDSWVGAGAGISGLSYLLSATSYYVRIELNISSSNKERNKQYFNQLLKEKDTIQDSFGNELVWKEFLEHKMSRIKFEMQNVNLFEQNDWDKMNEFIISNLSKFEKAFKPAISKLN
jgi:hypothetical protein